VRSVYSTRRRPGIPRLAAIPVRPTSIWCRWRAGRRLRRLAAGTLAGTAVLFLTHQRRRIRRMRCPCTPRAEDSPGQTDRGTLFARPRRAAPSDPPPGPPVPPATRPQTLGLPRSSPWSRSSVGRHPSRQPTRWWTGRGQAATDIATPGDAYLDGTGRISISLRQSGRTGTGRASRRAPARPSDRGSRTALDPDRPGRRRCHGEPVVASPAWPGTPVALGRSPCLVSGLDPLPDVLLPRATASSCQGWGSTSRSSAAAARPGNGGTSGASQPRGRACVHLAPGQGYSCL
jgi:hypothetical protein